MDTTEILVTPSTSTVVVTFMDATGVVRTTTLTPISGNIPGTLTGPVHLYQATVDPAPALTVNGTMNFELDAGSTLINVYWRDNNGTNGSFTIP